MKKKQLTVEQAAAAAALVKTLDSSIAVLRRNKFATLSEAALFCAAAAADANGHPLNLGEISAAADTPYTTASRLVYTLEQRGFLYYESVAGDRRKKLIRANLGALK